MNEDKTKSFQLKKRLNPSQTETVQTRRKKVASPAITATSTTTVFITNVQLQVQLLTSTPFIALPKYIPQETSVAVTRKEKKTEAKILEDFTGDEKQDTYLFI